MFDDQSDAIDVKKNIRIHDSFDTLNFRFVSMVSTYRLAFFCSLVVRTFNRA